MATVHLLCGLPGSGKTTLARRLERETRAVRFTLDEWMLRLYDLTPYDEEYGQAADRVKDLIWEVVGALLASGLDVVLDWSQWSRELRATAADRARELEAEVVLHFADVPLHLAERRIAERNADGSPGTHRIDLDDLRRFAAELFEPPAADEGIPIVREG